MKDQRERAAKKGSELLSKARALTKQEHDLSSRIDTEHYAAASLGQLPYIALPNAGVVVVRREGWGC